jgi:hypothetical protein
MATKKPNPFLEMIAAKKAGKKDAKPVKGGKPTKGVNPFAKTAPPKKGVNPFAKKK